MSIKQLLFYFLLIPSIFACKSNKEVSETVKPEETPPSAIIEDEVIVQLKDGTDIALFKKAFKNIGIKVLKSLGADMYLVTYDADKISSNEILRTLNQHELVKISEFNKRVSLRGGSRP